MCTNITIGNKLNHATKSADHMSVYSCNGNITVLQNNWLFPKRYFLFGYNNNDIISKINVLLCGDVAILQHELSAVNLTLLSYWAKPK